MIHLSSTIVLSPISAKTCFGSCFSITAVENNFAIIHSGEGEMGFLGWILMCDYFLCRCVEEAS